MTDPQRAHFLELIEKGWPIAKASREVGISRQLGRDWVRRAGLKLVRIERKAIYAKKKE